MTTDKIAGTIQRMGKIGQRLRDARLNSKLTLEQAGTVAGVTKQAVSQIERGVTKNPEAATLEPLARRYGVHLRWVMTGQGPRHLNDSAAEGHAPAIHGVKSHLLTLDQDILHDAITLLGYDEDHAGEYTPREHSARLAELYARLAADGGRLTTQHNREFTEEVHQRSQGSTHGKPTKAPDRRRPNNH